MVVWSRLYRVILSLALLGHLATAPQIFNSPISPRGWQAAKQASHELLTKLKTQRAVASSTGAAPQTEVLVERIFPSQPTAISEDTDSLRFERQCSCGLTYHQLAFPALALLLASGFLGWMVGTRSSRAGKSSIPSERSSAKDHSDPHVRLESVKTTAKAKPKGSKSSGQAGHKDSLKVSSRAEEADIKPAGGREKLKSAATSPTSSADSSSATRTYLLRSRSRPLSAASDPEQRKAEAAERQPDTLQSGACEAVQPALVSEPSPPRRSEDHEIVEQAAEAAEGPELGFLTPQPRSRGSRLAMPQSAPAKASPGWLQGRSGELLGPEGSGKSQHPVVEAVGDITVVMETLAHRLCLDVDSMSPQERMQLLQMALQCCQHRENSWLHAQANNIRSSHAAAAQGSLQHQKEQASAEAQRRLMEQFQTSLQDGLLAGLALMLGVLIACGIRCGYLGTRIGRCRSVSSLPSISLLRPWAALELIGILSCWTQATSDALLACCIMLGTAFVAVRGGVLRGASHDAPQLKLALGLGLVCGFAGYLSVARLGGDGAKWLVLWEGWVAMHLTASWQLPALHRALSRGPAPSLKTLLYQCSLSIILPLAMAILPFDSCLLRISGSVLAFAKA